MRIRRVNRYYCDFCKKSGGSKHHMGNHERGCTLNPNRSCGICYHAGEVQVDSMKLLVGMLPKVEEYTTKRSYGTEIDITDAANAALPALRDATENCPACIMAAIRQAGIPVPAVTDFDYRAEINSFWSDINETRRQEEYQGQCTG